MASSLSLPRQGWRLILPPLLKVISVAPSPPAGCPRAPAAPIPSRGLCPSPRCPQASAGVLPPGRGLCTGAQLRPWDGSWGEPPPLQPPQCLREGRGSPGENQAGVHQPALLLGLLARSHPAFHPNTLCHLGEALGHGPAVPVPGL